MSRSGSLDIKLDMLERSTMDSGEFTSRMINSRTASIRENPFVRMGAGVSGGTLRGAIDREDSNDRHDRQQDRYAKPVIQMQSSKNFGKDKPLGLTRAFSTASFGQRPTSTATLPSPKKTNNFASPKKASIFTSSTTNIGMSKPDLGIPFALIKEITDHIEAGGSSPSLQLNNYGLSQDAIPGNRETSGNGDTYAFIKGLVDQKRAVG